MAKTCKVCKKNFKTRGNLYCSRLCYGKDRSSKIEGKKFSKLTAIKFDHYERNLCKYWVFKCDCGKSKIIKMSSVTTGATKSCGCSMKEFNRIKNSGENSPSWQGGKSYEIYPKDWTDILKLSIRDRDKHICQICGKNPKDTGTLNVHHIDYNKKNCDPQNLISLCRKCHTKTNYKRDYWTNYFNTKDK